MAIYHFTAKAISMGSGESAVHRAAYHARTQLEDERNGKTTRDYAPRGDLAWSGIFAPKDAPDWSRDRGQLWNRAEKAERQANGQPARNIEFALPNELTREQQVRLLTDFSREQFARKGMIADVCLHSDFDAQGVRRPGVRPDEPRNDHAHMLLTMRRLDGDTFKKTKTDARDWNSKEQLVAWREGWAKAGAKALQKAGFGVEAQRFGVGHLTLPEQRQAALDRGDAFWAEHLDREPDIKQGAAVSQMEERGQKTDRGEKRRDIDDRNAERADLVTEAKVIDLELERIKRQEEGASTPKAAFNDAVHGSSGQGQQQRVREERDAADKIRSKLDERFRAQRARHDAADQNRRDDYAQLREDRQAQRDAVYAKYATALDAIWSQERPKVVSPDRAAWDLVNKTLASRKAQFDTREAHVWGQLVNTVMLGRGMKVTQLIRLALNSAERRRLFEREQRTMTAQLKPRQAERPKAKSVPPEPRRVQAERLKSMRTAELAGVDRSAREAVTTMKARHQAQRAQERDERTRFSSEAKEAWGQHRGKFAATRQGAAKGGGQVKDQPARQGRSETARDEQSRPVAGMRAPQGAQQGKPDTKDAANAADERAARIAARMAEIEAEQAAKAQESSRSLDPGRTMNR